MGEFVTKRRVEFAQTDMAGVAHFSEFFRYLESAEHEFLRSVGLSVHRAESDGMVLSWPRVSCGFDFSKPLLFEEEFEIRLRVERFGECSATYVAEILVEGDLRARGRCTTVCCAMGPDGMKAVPMPEAYRRALTTIQEESST